MAISEDAVASIAARLLLSDVLGVCVFEPSGGVVRVYGAARFWAPPVGALIDQAPLFVGLSERMRQLATEGGSLLMPNLRIAEADERAFDLRVFRLPDSNLMAAVSVEATERLEFYRQVEQEVRERRLLEEQVARQEQIIAEQARMMRLFIERVPAAVAMIDSNLDEIIVSERWRALNGPLGEATSQQQSENLRLTIENGVPSSRVERREAGDGVVWTRWDQTPWRRPDGSVAGAFVVREDVTSSERRVVRLLGRVRELERKQADWRGLAEAFAEGVSRVLDGVQSPDAKRSLTAGRAMVAAVEAYGRATRRPMRIQPLRLADVVNAVARTLDPRLRAANARLSVGALPTIRGDHELIADVFTRLIDNALRHGGEAPSIVIDGEATHGGAVVRVTDDGPGVSGARRTRAARRFFDPEPDERRAGEGYEAGLGMGLAFCRQAMERHRGALAFDGAWDAGLRVVLTFSDRPPDVRGRSGADRT